jgi:hypothetical protein
LACHYQKFEEKIDSTWVKKKEKIGRPTGHQSAT